MSFVLPAILPEKGAAIPLFATFTGHKRVPLWAVATNSVNPKLRFFPAEIELKVIKTHRRVWSDVERVDARTGRANFLTLDFAGTPWNFTASIVLPSHLREILRFLDARSLPLSARARQILESGAA